MEGVRSAGYNRQCRYGPLCSVEGSGAVASRLQPRNRPSAGVAWGHDRKATQTARAEQPAGPCFSGIPGGIRTPDLLVRSQALCPAELRGQPQMSHETYRRDTRHHDIVVNLPHQRSTTPVVAGDFVLISRAGL